MTTNVETFQFQAEARQVLELMIHSLYTNKEIFLRELISNASDALDRLRFEALSRPELIGADDRLEITIENDPKERTVTIHDSGIGMASGICAILLEDGESAERGIAILFSRSRCGRQNYDKGKHRCRKANTAGKTLAVHDESG